jgi:hypothetical protein
LGLTIGHGFKSWGDTASWSLFGLIYTAIKNSLSWLQPLPGNLMNVKFYEYVNEIRKTFLKRCEGVEPTTL